MRQYPYRLVNVFAESVFGGNPLCVFEHGDGLTGTEMQALALQFNLSETTFVLPSSTAKARVRIFTPTFEMDFAGHPTLGSAHVVRELREAGDALSLEMKAGVIPVTAEKDRWTFTANPPVHRHAGISKAQLADVLGLADGDILDGALWVNTGSDQLIVPLTSAGAVQRASPSAEKLAAIKSSQGRSMAYVFAPNGDGRLLSRFFFMKHTSVVEDPATGSATANLGGWMLANGKNPCTFAIEQGAQTGRPCHLGLAVSDGGQIQVTGNVIEIGRGVITLP
ncbi:MAG: PhzF family phenazine biosynthesis protein [Betaproteobacteria bacterium]|nr:PhzF family phenazine biosynthesis protein [Betaproteobacteria bacterium]